MPNTKDIPPSPSPWNALVPLLVCPESRQPLVLEDGLFRCPTQGTTYRLHEGIAQFARFGSAEQWGGEKQAETSESYQQNYQKLKEAANYNEMYARRWSKRWITRREYALLRRLLASQPHCATLLDLPSGGGRLSPQIAEYTDLLIEADIALGQVQYGKEFGRVKTPQVWMTASGFHIPFRDASLDGIVCVRLNHHLPTAEERERLVRELLRVAGKFVIMTFFDFHSLKNLGRRMRRPLDKKPPKMTMTVQRVRELADQGGFDLVEWPALACLGSGHRYALMVKRT
jgi:SAM-dependent methyltransferase